MPVSNAAHNGFLLLVQLNYGTPVNAFHGNLVFLVLYQVNDAPVTTTVAPTTIADVVTMHIVPDEAPSLAPLRIPLRIRFDTCAPKKLLGVPCAALTVSMFDACKKVSSTVAGPAGGAFAVAHGASLHAFGLFDFFPFATFSLEASGSVPCSSSILPAARTTRTRH